MGRLARIGCRERPGEFRNEQLRVPDLRDDEDFLELERERRLRVLQLDGDVRAARLDAERIAADRLLAA